MNEQSIVANTSGFDIFAVGAGQDWTRHMTIEGLSVIRQSGIVFYFGELAGFSQFLRDEQLRGVDLSDHAKFAEPRETTHERVCDTILQAATKQRPVVWVTQGNPALICGVTTLLRSKCVQLGLMFRIILAPSSLDNMIEVLGIDVANTGLQLFDASRLLLWRLRPRSEIPCLIVQLARAQTWLNPLDCKLRSSSLTALQTLLVSEYPADHMCKLVTCHRGGNEKSRVAEIRLENLCSSSNSVNGWTTLYIPAVESPQVKDTNFSKLLYDYSHLEDNYYHPISEVLHALKI